MHAYHPTQPSNFWMVALKLLILILGLYLSFIILGKVFAWVFVITFFLIRFLVISAVSFIVLHFFLKLLFNLDLLRWVNTRLFSR